MPELPEVEIVRAGLERLLAGATLARVDLHRPDLRRPMPPALGGLRGQVRAVRRRAKYLCIDLDGGGILCHLGMTGSWRIAADDRPHDHATLHLVDGRRLVFNDPRRFGLLDVLRPDGGHADLDGLGHEPLADDFTGRTLAACFRGRTGPVKPALMDQALVVGVGTIYAAESLFRAGIDPRTPAGSMRAARLDRLADCVRTVLAEAIAAGGSSIADFRHAGGEEGWFQHAFRVYGRAGQPCLTCSTTLRGTTLSGRATVWCPRCQRKTRR
jgi:formamidopyrimidine-DNA glycosylase